MKNKWTFMQRFAVLSLISGLAWASTTDPRLDMVATLKAIGPHRSLGDQAKVFDGLVGTWDVEYADFLKDGTVKRASEEFIVGWVLDGRAIQEGLRASSKARTESCFVASPWTARNCGGHATTSAAIRSSGARKSPATAAKLGDWTQNFT